MNDKDKNIISGLVKIAQKQQLILTKLAQQLSNQADSAINALITQSLHSWGQPLEVSASLNHTADIAEGSKSYEVNVKVVINNKEKLAIAKDPQRGFAAYLNKQFAQAAAGNIPQYKSLTGYTATFNVDIS